MHKLDFKGDKISNLSLGTVQFGLNYGISNVNGQPLLVEVQKIIDYVIKHGINCFDTASAYGNSEEVLGNVLKKHDNHFLISKLKSEEFHNHLDETLKKSLNKLCVESIYGLLLHDSQLLSSWTQKETSKVEQLIQSRKIKYFGVSIYTSEDFEAALENDSITLIQIPFNIFDQRAIAFNWFEKAKAKNKLIFIRSVFLQGLFFMDQKRLPKELQAAKEYLDRLEELALALSMSKIELALSYVNSVAKDSVILFGCDSFLQAQENISIFNTLRELSDDEKKNIFNIFKDVPENIFNPTKW